MSDEVVLFTIPGTSYTVNVEHLVSFEGIPLEGATRKGTKVTTIRGERIFDVDPARFGNALADALGY